MTDFKHVDVNGSLSDSWKGFTKFTSLKEEHPQGCMWSREGPTQIQATTQLENVWPEVWTKMGRPLSRKKRNNGQTRNQRSIMLESWEAFFLQSGR